MNAEAQPSTTSIGSVTSEPRAGRNTVPLWLIVLLCLLAYWGMVFFDQHSGWFSPDVYVPYRSVAEIQIYQPVVGEEWRARGKTVYENVCALCHNTDGMGKPGQAPPFAGSEWALGSPEHMIRIPLSGLTGSVSVKGQVWNLSMPAMGAALSDEDLAATLSYIRNSWGNKASVITPEQVKVVRAAVGNRTQPWTAELLKAIQ
jgi:mono/diheme cytochrome c family protein